MHPAVRAMLPLALFVTSASLPASAQSQPAPYRLDWLGPNFFPAAINDLGQVIGTDLLGRGYGPALRWDHGVITQLGEGQGNDINNLGTAVLGNPITGRGTPGAVVVSPDGWRTDLGLPHGWGGDFRHEFSINDAGQVVGMESNAANSDGRAFFWDGHSVTYIDVGLPAENSSAHAINNAGQVVGWWNSDALRQGGGFLWKNGTTTLLPSQGVSINNRGQVLLLTGQIWQNGTTTDPVPGLPLLPGSDPALEPRVELRELNEAAEVVGWTEEYYLIDPESGHGSIERAFAWDAAGGLQDLNALMGLEPEAHQYPLAQALDVNNAGQIVGYGPSGGWLLTPVPEPAAPAMLSAGGLLAFVPRRRVRCRAGV